MLDWQDLHKRTQEEDRDVRNAAVVVLGSDFGQIPDKVLAWQDILRLVQDKDLDVQISAVDALEKTFSQMPDKAKAWHDILLLIQNKDNCIRGRITYGLGMVFSQVTDKVLAWQDILTLAYGNDSAVRHDAVLALSDALDYVSDKMSAYNDLYRLVQDYSLIQDKDDFGRHQAVSALGKAFNLISDKAKAWQDIHRLAQCECNNSRENTANILYIIFSHVPNKSEAWQDLHRLTQDKDSEVRSRAAYVLGAAFNQIPDKSEAWQDVHRLAYDLDSNVRQSAASSLGYAFYWFSNKFEAWQDLHRLTHDEDNDVRSTAARAVGMAFSQIPDKMEALQDLYRLIQDKERSIQMWAYYSLGRASIYRSTEAENIDALKSELEAAVAYFGKSTQVPGTVGPANFCYPFYRTYLAIVFQKANEEEVQKNLIEAKKFIWGRESRAELLNAIESLVKAFYESQHLKNRPFHEVISELNTYRMYCERAAEHMTAAENETPDVVKLMRKCNPLIEDRIQKTIIEIQKMARQVCQATHGSGTVYETSGVELQRAAKALSTGDIANVHKCSSRIVMQLKKFCKLLSEDEKGPVCEVVEEIERESELSEKLGKIELALSYLSPILEDHRSRLVDIVIITVLPEEYNAICTQLSGVSSLDPPPNMDSKPNIYTWQVGYIPCQKFNGTYKVVVGITGRAGDIQSALAAKEAILLWKPHYIIFSGIAGGLKDLKETDAGPKKGDVIIADCIYGYEYGKIGKKFKPRGNWPFKTDQGLLTSAIVYSLQAMWNDHIKAKPPVECVPAVISGEIASGEKVVDDPTNEFFTQVLKMWPKVKAVEMEGAGIGSAIEQSQSLQIPIGFMVIRAISDLPRPKIKGDKTSGTKERDAWKIYASDAAATFIVGWIANGLPLPPST